MVGDVSLKKVGYAAAVINGNLDLGSIIERNGGQAKMSPSVGAAPIYPGFVWVSGTFVACQQDQQGYLSLDPAKYTGDTIAITMQLNQKENLECTCIGSACTYGMSIHK